jgi:hypothetical protein
MRYRPTYELVIPSLTCGALNHTHDNWDAALAAPDTGGLIDSSVDLVIRPATPLLLKKMFNTPHTDSLIPRLLSSC